MEWFGTTWGAPINATCPQVDCPVGEKCGWCREKIAPGDRGVTIPHMGRDKCEPWPYHIECFVRMIVVRKGFVRQLLPGGKIGARGTRAYYEICTDVKLLELARKKFTTASGKSIHD